MPDHASRSLATRLAAAVVALGSAIVLAGSIASYRSASAALRERLLEQLSSNAEDGAVHLTDWLVRQRDAVVVEAQVYARLPRAIPTRPDSQPLEQLPRDMLAAEELQLIAVPGGQVLRSSRLASVGSFAVDELFYREGRRAPFVQNIYYSGVTGRPRLTIAAPARTTTDSVLRAIVAAHLDLAQMEAAIGRQFVQSTHAIAGLPIEAYLVNADADFVSASRFGRLGIRRGVRSLAIDGARAGGRGTALYVNYAGVPVIGSWRWIPELEVGLIVEASQDVAFAPARGLLINTLLVGLVATALLALGVTVITRRFTNPVVLVARAATKVTDGDFTVTVPDRGDDEAAQLGRAFNVMTERLRSLYVSLESQVAATQHALDEAHASRALLQDVIDNAATLVLVVDLDGRVRLANARAASLSGISEHEAVGRTLLELFGSAAHRLEGVLARARERQLVVEQELELAMPGGTHGWQVVVSPLEREDGEVYAYGLIATDLTERARAEAERRARDASVQQAQKLESLGVMAGGIAHDFNNILGAIIGNAQLAQESLTGPAPDVPEAAEALAHIDTAGRRAAELTRQMLAYAGRASLRRDTVDLRRVVDDILPIVRASQSKKVRFAVAELPHPLWVQCDPAQLSQVILNLLTNAAEAIGDVSGVVTLTAGAGKPSDAAADTTESWLRVTVSDTGPGIPDEMRARIFDPFFSTKESGRGLGLAAVRGIVRSLGGILELTSSDSGGARFDIFLREAVPPELPAPLLVTRAARLTGTLLVVDDELLVRQLVVRVSQRMGLTVLEAEDGESSLRIFQEHASTISAVLLDLTMPDMNGAEVLAQIRQTHARLPVVVVSGYDADDALASIGKDDAVTFLQKPFSPDMLRKRIEDALREKASATS